MQRPSPGFGQLTENTIVPQWNQDNWRKDPLQSYVFAAELGGVSFRDLAARFFLINDELSLDEKVHGLAVLGSGVALYLAGDESHRAFQTFMREDRVAKLTPGYVETEVDSFYYFFLNLALQLHRTVLTAGDLWFHYGAMPKTRRRRTSILMLSSKRLLKSKSRIQSQLAELLPEYVALR